MEKSAKRKAREIFDFSVLRQITSKIKTARANGTVEQLFAKDCTTPKSAKRKAREIFDFSVLRQITDKIKTARANGTVEQFCAKVLLNVQD